MPVLLPDDINILPPRKPLDADGVAKAIVLLIGVLVVGLIVAYR